MPKFFCQEMVYGGCKKLWSTRDLKCTGTNLCLDHLLPNSMIFSTALLNDKLCQCVCEMPERDDINHVAIVFLIS